MYSGIFIRVPETTETLVFSKICPINTRRMNGYPPSIEVLDKPPLHCLEESSGGDTDAPLIF